MPQDRYNEPQAPGDYDVFGDLFYIDLWILDLCFLFVFGGSWEDNLNHTLEAGGIFTGVELQILSLLCSVQNFSEIAVPSSVARVVDVTIFHCMLPLIRNCNLRGGHLNQIYTWICVLPYSLLLSLIRRRTTHADLKGAGQVVRALPRLRLPVEGLTEVKTVMPSIALSRVAFLSATGSTSKEVVAFMMMRLECGIQSSTEFPARVLGKFYFGECALFDSELCWDADAELGSLESQ
jgi:hypothetical protein